MLEPIRDSRPVPPPDNTRVHIDDPLASWSVARALGLFMAEIDAPETIVMCIGTDRSTGDCLGPLIGTRLRGNPLASCTVYGTLDEPVHATNLSDTLDLVRATHPTAMVVAVDACLGRTDSVGFVNVCPGPLKPGTGVNKSLPAVGDCHITGVVNVGGCMEFMVLQNTRLHLVFRMAEIIGAGIVRALALPDSRYRRLSSSGGTASARA